MCSASHDGVVAPPVAELKGSSTVRECRRSAGGRGEVVVDDEGCRRSAGG